MPRHWKVFVGSHWAPSALRSHQGRETSCILNGAKERCGPSPGKCNATSTRAEGCRGENSINLMNRKKQKLDDLKATAFKVFGVRTLCFLKNYWGSSRALDFPCGSAGKESACSAGDLGSIPELGRSPGEGKGYPLQYSGLENSVGCIVCGVAKSQTRLSNFHFKGVWPCGLHPLVFTVSEIKIGTFWEWYLFIILLSK